MGFGGWRGERWHCTHFTRGCIGLPLPTCIRLESAVSLLDYFSSLLYSFFVALIYYIITRLSPCSSFNSVLSAGDIVVRRIHLF